MLDRKLIREQPEFVAEQARRKGVEAPVDEFLRVDQEWRGLLQTVEQLQAESNRISKTIGQLMGQGKKDEAEAAKAQTADLKAQLKEMEPKARELELQLHEIELRFPNLPHASVPEGNDADDNVTVRTWGEAPTGEFVNHITIAEELKLIDFARATKVSGSGFAVYTGWGAKLQRALINYMADLQVSRGYLEVYPPALVTSQSLEGTGNLPKFAEDLYATTDDLWLVPTAEVPVTNLYRDEIFEYFQVPMKLAAYTPCFRREAGAAGRDTRGILRMHQFDKVELVKYVHPETSYDELESLVEDAEAVLQSLGLHYRVLLLCAGDMGEKGCKCYDVEVWAPGEGRYLEVSSCTNFEAYQARRANIRFRPAPEAKPEFVHILNGSGTAVPRLMVALLETHRQPDGSIRIPEPLRPYMGVDYITAEAP
jgi:seryl-tRNA synthetase